MDNKNEVNLHCDSMYIAAGTCKTAGNRSQVCYIKLYSRVMSQYFTVFDVLCVLAVGNFSRLKIMIPVQRSVQRT